MKGIKLRKTLALFLCLFLLTVFNVMAGGEKEAPAEAPAAPAAPAAQSGDAWVPLPVAPLADGYPERTITIVAPFGYGGGWDTFGRALVLAMRKDRRIGFELINKPGGDGITALNYVNEEPADGYTVMGLEGSITIAMAEGKTNLSVIDDFIPLIKAVETPMAIYTKVDSPYKTFQDLVAAIKKDPNLPIGATDAAGGFFNIACLKIFKNAGVDIKYVSFGGEASRTITAALGGHIAAVLDVVTVFDPHVQSGRMRPLLALTDERLPQYPDIPTAKELGLDTGMPKHWRGFAVKKGTPADRVELIKKVLLNGLHSSLFTATAKDNNMVVSIVEGDALMEFLKGQVNTFETILYDIK